MRTFKLIGAIAKNQKTLFLIHLGVFFFVFLVLAQTNTSTETAVSEQKAKLAILNQSEEPLAQELVRYLEKQHDMIPLPASQEAQERAIFEQRVDYILRIPQHIVWNDRGMIPFETVVGMNGTVNRVVDQQITQFVSIYQSLKKELDGLDSNQQAEVLRAVMQESSTVQVAGTRVSNQQQINEEISRFLYLLAFVVYFLISIGFSVIGTLISRTEASTIQIRERASGLDDKKQTGKLLLASIGFLLLVWVVVVLLSLGISGFNVLRYPQVHIALLSSFVHTLMLAAMILFVMQIFPNVNAASFFSTILSLFVAFMTGIFVPEFLLPDIAKTVSRVLPSFWHVQSLHYLESVSAEEMQLSAVLPHFTILIGVGLLMAMLTLILRHERHKAQ